MPEIIEEEYDFSKEIKPKCSKEVADAVKYVTKFYTDFMRNNNTRFHRESELKAASNTVLKKFGLIPVYPSVRQFIEERESGAYNTFTFNMENNVFTCHTISDFEGLHNSALLDLLIVTKYKSTFVNDPAQGGTTYILDIASAAKLAVLTEEEENNGN